MWLNYSVKIRKCGDIFTTQGTDVRGIFCTTKKQEQHKHHPHTKRNKKGKQHTIGTGARARVVLVWKHVRGGSEGKAQCARCAQGFLFTQLLVLPLFLSEHLVKTPFHHRVLGYELLCTHNTCQLTSLILQLFNPTFSLFSDLLLPTQYWGPFFKVHYLTVTISSSDNFIMGFKRYDLHNNKLTFAFG